LIYRVVKKPWRYVKPFRENTGVWQTDRQTDMLYQYSVSVGMTDVRRKGTLLFQLYGGTHQ